MAVISVGEFLSRGGSWPPKMAQQRILFIRDCPIDEWWDGKDRNEPNRLITESVRKLSYRTSTEVGRAMGKKVGEYVLQNYLPAVNLVVK